MSSAADAVRRRIAAQAAEKAAWDADEIAFTAAVRRSIDARLARINPLASQIIAATDREAAMRLAWGFDGNWDSEVTDAALPGGEAAANRIKAGDNYRPGIAIIDAPIHRFNHASAIARKLLFEKFGQLNPPIMGAVIDRKYGDGNYIAWIRAVTSPTWWDSKGVPLITAALFAYVSAGLMEGLSAPAAEGGAVAESSVSVGGIQTGLSTGSAALDTVIGEALTGAIVPQQHAAPPAAPAPQPAPAQPMAQAANSSTSWLPYLAIGAAILGAVT